MKEAGFGGVFCNIKDYPAERWSEVRKRASAQGMFCGPWSRTSSGMGGAEFDPNLLEALITCADAWESPLIVNSEKEIDGSGDDLTSYIAEEVGDREAALSVEPIPFASVDWTPVAHLPILPQLFHAEQGAKYDPYEVKALWHSRGVQCVFFTFGTYGGMQPQDFPLQAPYSLYTGDDCGNNFQPWKPTSTGYEGCIETPPDGGDMQKIGSQHGVTSAMNRLRTLDPAGTLLVADPYTGKWPSIETLTQPLDQWKAYDKLERSLTILVSDHDEAMVFTDTEEAPMGEEHEVGTQSEPTTPDEESEVVQTPPTPPDEGGAGPTAPEESPSESPTTDQEEDAGEESDK